MTAMNVNCSCGFPIAKDEDCLLVLRVGSINAAIFRDGSVIDGEPYHEPESNNIVADVQCGACTKHLGTRYIQVLSNMLVIRRGSERDSVLLQGNFNFILPRNLLLDLKKLVCWNGNQLLADTLHHPCHFLYVCRGCGMPISTINNCLLIEEITKKAFFTDGVKNVELTKLEEDKSIVNVSCVKCFKRLGTIDLQWLVNGFEVEGETFQLSIQINNALTVSPGQYLLDLDKLLFWTGYEFLCADTENPWQGNNATINDVSESVAGN